MVRVLKQCERELLDWPEEVRGDLADAVARLERGHTLSMPLSRPMPSVGAGVHELRFRDRSGIYRMIYALAIQGELWLVLAFQKKTEATPAAVIDTAKQRLRRIRS